VAHLSIEEEQLNIVCPCCKSEYKLDLKTLQISDIRRPLRNLSKRKIRRILIREQGGRKCIVPSCQESGKLHLHRCLSGRNGGRYIPSNTVLVCERHHPLLEGCRSKEEVIARAQVIGGQTNTLEISDQQLKAEFAEIAQNA